MAARHCWPNCSPSFRSGSVNDFPISAICAFSRSTTSRRVRQRAQLLANQILGDSRLGEQVIQRRARGIAAGGGAHDMALRACQVSRRNSATV
jgi:hypothetical protein